MRFVLYTSEYSFEMYPVLGYPTLPIYHPVHIPNSLANCQRTMQCFFLSGSNNAYEVMEIFPAESQLVIVEMTLINGETSLE